MKFCFERDYLIVSFLQRKTLIQIDNNLPVLRNEFLRFAIYAFLKFSNKIHIHSSRVYYWSFIYIKIHNCVKRFFYQPAGYKVKEIAGLVEEYLRKEILVDDFVTGRMPLNDINKGFELLRQGKG